MTRTGKQPSVTNSNQPESSIYKICQRSDTLAVMNYSLPCLPDFPKASTLLLALAAMLFAVTAQAQWQWIEKDGRKVFSDRSPPAEIQDKDILKRPPGASRSALATDAALNAAANPASASLPKASAPKLSGKDAELEAKKKKADDEEAAKKKAEDDKLAKAKAENCERAKGGLAALQSGVRMAAVNAKGEREVYDDAKRQSETKRTQDIIDSSCK